MLCDLSGCWSEAPAAGEFFEYLYKSMHFLAIFKRVTWLRFPLPPSYASGIIAELQIINHYWP